jgi:hypothetical protein
MIESERVLVSLTAREIYPKLEKVEVANELILPRNGRIGDKNELNGFLSENKFGVKVSVMPGSGDFLFANWVNDEKELEGWLVQGSNQEFFFIYYLHSGTVGDPELRSDYHLAELEPNTTTRFKSRQ